MTMALTCIKHTVKENLLLLRDFIRTLKNKIYKHMTATSKNVNIDQLNEIVDKYNNTLYRTIKTKPAYVKLGTYIDCGVENNDKDPKFKVSDQI